MALPDEENPDALAAALPDDTAETPPPEENAPAKEAEVVPDNYQGLADAARELEPVLKESENLPKPGATGPEGAPERGPDGKFLPKGKDTLAAEVSGATGAAEAQTGATGTSGTHTRDTDLEVKPDAHMRPTTRKVIDQFREQAVAARNERDAAKAEIAAFQKRLAETEDKLKTIKAPKEMEEELTTLRSRVRELDISKDPAIQQKYDARIKKNGETALGLLKDQGLFTVAQKDGPAKEMTEQEKKVLTTELERQGFGVRGMAKYISSLEKAGEYEAAERLRHAAQETDRLAQEKEEEIATWSKDYEGFQAERGREAQTARESYLASVKTAGERQLQQDLTDLAKRFPHLNPPAPVQATDTAEIKAAKEKALSEYNAASAALETEVKQFNADGLPPDKAALAYGKLQASAVQAIVLKQRVIPQLEKERDLATARVKELETELGKIRKAGTINRAHSAAITSGNTNGKAPSANLTLEDAARQIAAELGVKTD